jgi:hypothetical protein
MNISDRLKEIEARLAEIWKLLMPVRAAGGGSGGPHNLLSGTHTDTTAGAPARGDLIVADSNPKWKKLAKGSSGQVLQADANDALWGAVPVHASRHQSGGADAIKLDDLAAPDNNTDLDSSAAAHGLMKKLDNDTTHFMRGDGTWTQIAGSGASIVKLWTPDAFIASPAAQSDHFDDASLAAKWTEWDPGGLLSISEADSFAKLAITNNAAEKWSGMYQTCPAGDFTIIAKLNILHNAGANYVLGALALFKEAIANPSTTDFYSYYTTSGANGAVGLTIQAWNQWDAFGGNTWNPSGSYWANPQYLRIRRNGTTWYFDWSPDGLTWALGYSMAQAWAPDSFGIIGTNYNSGGAASVWSDWFSYEAADNFNPPGREVSFWTS